VARVCVCDRRGQGGTGSKGDRRDAEELAELLRVGALRPVHYGGASRATLRELARCYQCLVDDSTRVWLRLKALLRARGIKTAGRTVYRPREQSAWLRQFADPGAWFRAQALYAELEVLQRHRPTAKAALLGEARRDPAWGVLQTVPFFGPVRVALLMAILQTPWRFRTMRQLWAYAGLAVVHAPARSIRSTEGGLCAAHAFL
jgi:transposase